MGSLGEGCREEGRRGWAVGPGGGTRSAAVEKREEVGKEAVMRYHREVSKAKQ